MVAEGRRVVVVVVRRVDGGIHDQPKRLRDESCECECE
jgi:hypothetical protein